MSADLFRIFKSRLISSHMTKKFDCFRQSYSTTQNYFGCVNFFLLQLRNSVNFNVCREWPIIFVDTWSQYLLQLFFFMVPSINCLTSSSVPCNKSQLLSISLWTLNCLKNRSQIYCRCPVWAVCQNQWGILLIFSFSTGSARTLSHWTGAWGTILIKVVRNNRYLFDAYKYWKCLSLHIFTYFNVRTFFLQVSRSINC